MNMYVSNLSFHTTDADLNNLFSEFGEVSSSKVITDRATGRSRGFGFVEMPEEADAKKAMEALNGKDLEGRAISVTLARPKEDRSGGSFSQNRKRW